MKKIFIAAGHSPSKPGAQGNGYKEELLAIELVDLIVAELKALGVNPVVDNHQNDLSKTTAFFRNLLSVNSIVLDIHWNAAGIAAATGTETLVPAQYTKFEYNLAAELSNTVSRTLGIRMRGEQGVKTEADSHHGRLGWMRLTGENVLMEICFITNPVDMQKYQANKLQLAKNIALILKNNSEK